MVTMRPSIRQALPVFLCALVLLSTLVSRRVPAVRAARVSDAGQQAQQEQQKGAKKEAATASNSSPAVREVDVEGLKKLLARENGRPLLVNFWATWCEPCRAEFPDLIKIDAEYRSRGLDFIIVSIDDVSEINTTVPQFLKEMRAGMPSYLLNTPEPEAAIEFVDPRWSGSLPATFLYDAQGKVVFRHLGRVKPEELRAAIKTVISDK